MMKEDDPVPLSTQAVRVLRELQSHSGDRASPWKLNDGWKFVGVNSTSDEPGSLRDGGWYMVLSGTLRLLCRPLACQGGTLSS